MLVGDADVDVADIDDVAEILGGAIILLFCHGSFLRSASPCGCADYISGKISAVNVACWKEAREPGVWGGSRAYNTPHDCRLCPRCAVPLRDAGRSTDLAHEIGQNHLAVRAGRQLRYAGAHYRGPRSEEHTSELQSHSDLVCRLLLE